MEKIGIEGNVLYLFPTDLRHSSRDISFENIDITDFKSNKECDTEKRHRTFFTVIYVDDVAGRPDLCTGRMKILKTRYGNPKNMCF
jgi:hypothetical protein